MVSLLGCRNDGSANQSVSFETARVDGIAAYRDVPHEMRRRYAGERDGGATVGGSGYWLSALRWAFCLE